VPVAVPGQERADEEDADQGIPGVGQPAEQKFLDDGMSGRRTLDIDYNLQKYFNNE
jgi:hypothetical protein